MNAIYAMLSATVIASLYPLAATLGIEDFDPFAFVFLASFISFLTSLTLIYVWTKKTNIHTDWTSSQNKG